MKGRQTKWLILGLVLAIFGLSTPRAEATMFYFDFANEFGAWGGSVPPGYGSIDVTKGANDWIYFEVNANTDYFSPADSLTWDKFYFNFNPEKTLDTNLLVVDQPGTWSVVEDKNVSMFGIFDFGEEGTALGSTGIDPLTFHIMDPSLLIDDFVYPGSEGYLFAGHLKRFDQIEGQTSTFLGSGNPPPVPEPMTFLLLGAGLLGMGVARKMTHHG